MRRLCLAALLLIPSLTSAQSADAPYGMQVSDSELRFSLLFYSDLDTAQTINNGVTRSPAARLLRENGLLLETGLADLSGDADAALEATSDPSWPDAIQRSWPWFIMGVSQSWLRLISEVRTARPLAGDPSAGELIAYYQRI
ncbi:MAG TPA: hypothetical protein VGB36_04310, partial [Gammaproteobacteria bacterium]